MANGYWSLLKRQGFLGLLGGLVLSSLALGMLLTAVSVTAAERITLPNPAAAVTIASLAGNVPGVIVGWALAKFVRGRSGKFLLFVDASFRCFALTLLAVLIHFDVVDYASFVLLIGLSGLGAVMGGAGQYLVVAEIVDGAAARNAANALITTADSAALIVGPALAGLLLETAPLQLIFLLAGLGYLSLLIVLATIRVDPGKAGEREAVTGSIKRGGLSMLMSVPGIRGLVVMNWMFNFLYGPLVVGLPLVIIVQRGLAPTVLGYCWSAFGLGAVIGGLIAGRLGTKNIRRTTAVCMGLWGLSLVGIIFYLPSEAMIAFFLFGGCAYAPVPVLFRSALQESFSTEDLGVAAASWGALSATAQPTGVAAGGAFAQALSAIGAVAVSGTGSIALGVYGVGSSHRKRGGGNAEHTN